MKVYCSAGEVDVLPGDRWQDLLTRSRWEVVEPDPNSPRIYSPSGWGGTPIIWCRLLDLLEEADTSASTLSAHGAANEQWAQAKVQSWLREARADGCVAFCADSVAGGVMRERTWLRKAHAAVVLAVRQADEVRQVREGAHHG